MEARFALHELIERKTGVDIYLLGLINSWERGCNENTNGLNLESSFLKNHHLLI